ncbi:MAG TPA: AraC family transcriptional regulator [Sphingobium sp.]|nr:AraC family transcriptional regulator [Sphingobium sp.]
MSLIGKAWALVALASVRGSIVAAVLSEFAARGGDRGRLLEQFGLNDRILADPYTSVPLASYVAMFEHMAELLDEPLLGARLGMAMRPVDLGPAGLVMARSGSMKAALARMNRFFHSLQQSTHSDMREEDGMLICTYQLGDAAIWPRRQDAEYSMSALLRLCRTTFRTGWQPVEAQFEHLPATPASGQALERLLGCRVRYGAAVNGVSFLVDEARAPCRDEDRDVIDVLERHLAESAPPEEVKASWRDKVLALIAVSLGHRPVTIERLAADLAISPRSLQRRLEEEGTSLRALLRDYRQEVAERQLRTGTPALAHLAETLGYADGTTFWRAHRNWTGMSPKAVRANPNGKPPASLKPN